MIEKLNSKIRPLLEIYDNLRDVLELANINIPIIATCGMQSHGKSSTLESITKIQLPTKAETCTICPIKICLRETKDKPYFNIKLVDEEYIQDDKKITNFKILKNKIDEYQNKVRRKCNLKDAKITSSKIIQLDVYKNNVPNLNLYDLPGVTFVDGIKEEAEKIYGDFLDNEETTVLLILNGGDDLTNSSVIEWMKKAKNYKKRFIPIVAKADLIQNFEGKMKQLRGLKLNNKPCLIINKNKDSPELKNLSDVDEVKKIKEVIKNIDQYKDQVILGRRKLIDELIKIQYEKYKESFRGVVDKINIEIKRYEDRLKLLPQEFETKEEFYKSFIDMYEKNLEDFKKEITKFKKGPISSESNLLKRVIKVEYENFIVKAKEKVNNFFTLEFCNYVTKNTNDTNCDNISIVEDTIPFKRLIKPEIEDILKIFEEIINKIFIKITNTIEETIKKTFSFYTNLRYKVNELFKEYADKQQEKMKKFYEDICALETKNVTSFDLELNYKCNVLVRKIMHFLFKKEEKIEDKKEEKIEDKKEEKKEDDKEPEEKEQKKDEDKEQEDEEEIKDTSDNRISDDRDDIISGVKNINKLVIKAFRELTQTTIEKLTKEVVTNPNYKKNVKEKYEEYKNDITQIVGIINNYEIEQLTRTYDSLGTKGRPKMAYNPEELTTFDERIEEIVLKEKGEYEFIPGYQFIKNESLNSFIDLFKAGKVNKRIANTIVKMVAYSEVVCNRFIDYIYLSIQNYLYA